MPSGNGTLGEMTLGGMTLGVLATGTVAGHQTPGRLLDHGTVAPGWPETAAVVLLACAAALYVVAGALRLARWRLTGDPHSALVGSALLVMGALYLPLEGIAAVGGALQHRVLAETAIRALVSFVTMAIVVRAVHATTVRALDRPSRLLPLLAAPVLALFGGLVAVEASMSEPVSWGPSTARALSGAVIVGWLVLAALVRTRNSGIPWSRRAALLCVSLAVAEAFYGLDSGAEVATAVGLLVCTVVAALGLWSAHLDLAASMLQAERAFGSLSHTLRDARREAVELAEWRANLVHDADNAVAGLRAALDVLGERDAHADGPAGRLCRAAADEVHHLDHLLHRSPDEECRAFDVAALVRRVGRSTQALGSDVTVRGDHALALGRPGDVVAVLKNLLANASRHAPGAAVELRVECVDGQVRIVCTDDGPGLQEVTRRHAFERGFRGPASVGQGLGLHEARRLMRAQGGDLLLEPRDSGARFVATLPHFVEAVARIPSQRVAPITADAVGVPGLPVALRT